MKDEVKRSEGPLARVPADEGRADSKLIKLVNSEKPTNPEERRYAPICEVVALSCVLHRCDQLIICCFCVLFIYFLDCCIC